MSQSFLLVMGSGDNEKVSNDWYILFTQRCSDTNNVVEHKNKTYVILLLSNSVFAKNADCKRLNTI